MSALCASIRLLQSTVTASSTNNTRTAANILSCRRYIIFISPSSSYLHQHPNMSSTRETSHSSSTATISSPPHQTPSLLERIRSLNRSDLSQRYMALILFHPSSKSESDDSTTPIMDDSSSLHVVVGHAEKSFVNSILINCKNQNGRPVFVREMLPNIQGVMTEVLMLYVDAQMQMDMKKLSGSGSICNGDECISATNLFQKRTSEFEHVTNHLISSGVISRKHSDVYPVSPFVESADGIEKGEKEVLAHINRSAAPYLGIDSVGVHLHCYVCEQDVDTGGGRIRGNDKKKRTINGVWLSKRALTKSHHPGYWDPTVAGNRSCLTTFVSTDTMHSFSA